jgi:hypothetical protein
MSLGVEGVLNYGMNGQESLGGSRRLEPLHFSLAPSRRLMRVLGAVVLAQSLFVAGGQSEIRFGGGIGAKLIRDKKFRRKALLLEQLSQEFHRRTFVAPALDEKVLGLRLRSSLAN